MDNYHYAVRMMQLTNENFKYWIMRIQLITFFIIAVLSQLSAASGYAQHVTIRVQKQSLEIVLKEIKKQSGYDLLYNPSVLSRNAEPVTMATSDGELKAVLDEIFQEQLHLEYVINKDIIVVRLKEMLSKTKALEPEQQQPIRGRVTNEKGEALVGASVYVLDAEGRRTTAQTKTDEEGYFELPQEQVGTKLEVAYLGYTAQKLLARSDMGLISLKPFSAEVDEVEVVSTGYQKISKERIVGSVDVLDQKLIDRSVSSNILSRINGLTTGLQLPKINSNEGGNQPEFTIRGKSTLFANAEPLIIVDGFPYDGGLSSLNPADIASISILKDGAAASIWGARSGNGVVVISTKQGSKDRLSLSAEVIQSIADKPDLYYSKSISSSDFIDVEKFLYEKGAYNARLKTGYQPVSPVVEILDKMSKGQLSDEVGNEIIDAYRLKDSRIQRLKYFYQIPLEQQYNLAISRPFKDGSFYISGGLNRQDQATKYSKNERKTLLMKYDQRFLNDRLNFFFQTNLTDTRTQSAQNSPSMYPYEELVSADGSPVPVTGSMRNSYVDTVGNGNLLDWHYNPLTDLGKGMSTSLLFNLRLNGGIDAKIFPFLTASVKYQYTKSMGDDLMRYADDSYYVRNLVNTYTRYDNATGKYVQQIPVGENLTINHLRGTSYLWRGQLALDKRINKDHHITALMAMELSDAKSEVDKKQLFGYDSSTATSATIDHINALPRIYGGSQVINDGNYQGWHVDRYRSYLLNAAYSYKSIYDVYGSIRRDESNLFGVATNQKGVPLWSVGGAYNAKQGLFNTVKWLSELRVRSSYGVQGNVDKTMSAWLTARYENFKNSYQNIFATIVNPPNPSLRWEKTKVINIGLDFGVLDQRVVMHIDRYWKNGKDLIGNGEIAPQTGLTQFRGNVADTQIEGFDLSVTSKNLVGRFQWQSVFNFSKAKDKVVRYLIKQANNFSYMATNYLNPYEGFPQTALFSFPYAGLDNEGNPIGYLDGVESKDYSAILNSKDMWNMKYHGPRIPPFFGSFRNNFSYGRFYASFNTMFQFGGYFRRLSLSNTALYSATTTGASIYDYDKRWQQPGDEALTNVPGLIYPANSARSNLFAYSDVLVEKSDVIRLQDIQIGARILDHTKWIKSLDMTFVVDNAAILWRANPFGLDPAVFQSSFPTPRQFSLRIRTTF
ncbi:SusC/RagA family TonB-linked outer membrane protein [Sphingobacterium yanglingense]|uniref:TonB-linked SusC/RagA family outer membrane protein n=1 Tax=Sphingobacterium yanglingense TaxID=1437280 RepID=A0A4R6WGL8_9SPHI|nr:SusC/RagA family TonB-linked outer membrane protein [Sphingobacterium yanglingense]TDQ79303.1 TonB-linked SusC/RagA family outer membrane protein [Sphingobacterium yanglingense]